MRLSCRSLPLLRAAFLLALLSIPSSFSWGQTPSQQSAQLPANWNDAVRSLAAKIALATAPSQALQLDVKNISTLSSEEAVAIRQALEKQLKERNVRFATTSSAEVRVEVTLSDSVEGHIAVAAIRRGNEQQTIILPTPNDPVFTEGRQRESLTLTAKLVRRQPEKILDFALFNRSPVLESTLLIVEPDRLVFYRSASSEWEPERTIRIPHSTPAVRDVEAIIKVEQNEIVLSDAECSGLLNDPAEVHCDSSGARHSWSSPFHGLPGHDGSVYTALSEKCDGGLIELVSGTGDWTQLDSIQGFENVQVRMPAVPAGNTLNFEGPIMSLVSNGEGVVARVVVRNLKTGKYEAYLVTATCSH
jgi:hypothetical protein